MANDQVSVARLSESAQSQGVNWSPLVCAIWILSVGASTPLSWRWCLADG